MEEGTFEEEVVPRRGGYGFAGCARVGMKENRWFTHTRTEAHLECQVKHIVHRLSRSRSVKVIFGFF